MLNSMFLVIISEWKSSFRSKYYTKHFQCKWGFELMVSLSTGPTLNSLLTLKYKGTCSRRTKTNEEGCGICIYNTTLASVSANTLHPEQDHLITSLISPNVCVCYLRDVCGGGGAERFGGDGLSCHQHAWLPVSITIQLSITDRTN